MTKYVIEDNAGNPYPITNIYNSDGDEIEDIHDAASIVVQVPNGWLPLSMDGQIVHTVN